MLKSSMKFEGTRAYRDGIITALVVCAAGFGAMNAIWFSSDYGLCERGLYYYRAATWGDGLFLPIGAGATVSWLRLSRKFRKTGALPAAVISCIAIVVGAAIQASWLINDDTQLNWTIPQPHMFNAAGWYHAAFFVAAFGFFTFLLVKFWVVSHQAHAPNTAAHRFLEIAIWLGVAGYLAMHVLDDYSAQLGKALACMTPAILSIVIAAVFYLGRNTNFGSWLQKSAAVAPGALFAFGLSTALAFPYGSIQYQAPMGFALACLFASSITFPRSLSKGISTCYEVMVCGGLGLAMLSLHVSGSWLEIATVDIFPGALYCLLGVALFVACSLCLGSYRNLNPKMVLAGIGATIAGIAWLITFNSPVEVDTNSIIGDKLVESIPHLILTLVVLGCVAYRAKGNVAYVMEAENSTGSYDARCKAAIQAQKIAYPQVAIMAICALSLLLFDMLKLRPESIGTAAWPEIPSVSPARVIIFSVIVLSLALLVAYAISHGSGSRSIAAGTLVVAASYAVVFYYVTEMRRPLTVDWWYAWSLFAPIGSAFLIGESFISDCALIRHKPCDVGLFSIAGVIAVGSYLVSVGCIVPTESAEGNFYSAIWSPGVGLLGVVVANVFIPTICAMAIQIGKPRPKQHLVLNTAIAGVAQNGMAATVAVVLLGVLPMAIYANTPIVLLAVVSFTILAVKKIGKIIFPLAANARHLAARTHDYTLLVEDKDAALEELRSLSRHLQRQAVITMTVFLPWIFFILAADALIQRIKSDKGGYSNYLWREYLLRLPSQEVVMLFVELAPLTPHAQEKYAMELAELADQGISLTAREL